MDERDSGIAFLVQRRHQRGLLPEPRDESVVPGEVRAQDLQCDSPANAELLGQVHSAHAALTQFALDSIPALDDAPDEWIGTLAGPAHHRAILRTYTDIVRIIGLANGAILHRVLVRAIGRLPPWAGQAGSGLESLPENHPHET